MAELKTTGIIDTFKAEEVKLSLSDDGDVSIKQGDNIIFIKEDEFKSFMSLAAQWFKTCRRFGC